jgi:hypothetical protein
MSNVKFGIWCQHTSEWMTEGGNDPDPVGFNSRDAAESYLKEAKLFHSSDRTFTVRQIEQSNSDPQLAPEKTEETEDNTASCYDMPTFIVGETANGDAIAVSFTEVEATGILNTDEAEMLVEQLTTLLRIRRARNVARDKAALPGRIAAFIIDMYAMFEARADRAQAHLKEAEGAAPKMYTCHFCSKQTSAAPQTLPSGRFIHACCSECTIRGADAKEWS